MSPIISVFFSKPSKDFPSHLEQWQSSLCPTNLPPLLTSPTSSLNNSPTTVTSSVFPENKRCFPASGPLHRIFFFLEFSSSRNQHLYLLQGFALKNLLFNQAFPDHPIKCFTILQELSIFLPVLIFSITLISI